MRRGKNVKRLAYPFGGHRLITPDVGAKFAEFVGGLASVGIGIA